MRKTYYYDNTNIDIPLKIYACQLTPENKIMKAITWNPFAKDNRGVTTELNTSSKTN